MTTTTTYDSTALRRRRLADHLRDVTAVFSHLLPGALDVAMQAFLERLVFSHPRPRATVLLALGRTSLPVLCDVEHRLESATWVYHQMVQSAALCELYDAAEARGEAGAAERIDALRDDVLASAAGYRAATLLCIPAAATSAEATRALEWYVTAVAAAMVTSLVSMADETDEICDCHDFRHLAELLDAALDTLSAEESRALLAQHGGGADGDTPYVLLPDPGPSYSRGLERLGAALRSMVVS